MRYISLAIIASLALAGCSSKEVKTAQVVKTKPKPVVKKVVKKKPKKMNGSTVRTTVSRGTVYAKNKELYETECNAGEAKGCNDLGVLYENGLGGSKNFYKAYQLNKKGCELGDGWACAKVGEFYKEGKGISKNLRLSTEYYQKGCELNDGISCNQAGQGYAEGYGVRQDRGIAEEYYKKAAALGYAGAYNNLGFLYASQGDVEKGKVFFKKACDLKEKMGCSNLAYTYKQEKNFASAYSNYVRACNYGDAEACNYATMMIFNQKNGVPSEQSRMYMLSLKSCELKNKMGCSNLAYLYEKGIGVTKNSAKAQKFYKKACKLGDTDSCKKLVPDNQVAVVK